MFWIFKIFPDWFWLVPLVLGICAFGLSHLPPLKLYALPLKIVGGILVACGIFVNGMLYANNRWHEAASKLEAQVQAAQAQSQVTNAQLEQKITVKTQVVRERGRDVVQYIEREVAQHNSGCVVPPEFVRAHNTAAEPPR